MLGMNAVGGGVPFGGAVDAVRQHGSWAGVNREAYRREVDYLVRYAHDDWLGFSVISGSVGSMLGRGASFEEQLGLLLRIVCDLYDAGVRAGDLTESPTKPFLAWPAGRAEALARIAAEVRASCRLPDSGDICWFAAP
ncbi:hypothetical protein BCL76_115192 [Streptomyces sp. CG 926]|nr:hypothetical protein BCL76_115192 [Streptomyces sp. CG 926]